MLFEKVSLGKLLHFCYAALQKGKGFNMHIGIEDAPFLIFLPLNSWSALWKFEYDCVYKSCGDKGKKFWRHLC